MPVIHIPSDYLYIESLEAAGKLLQGIAEAIPLQRKWSREGEGPLYFLSEAFSNLVELMVTNDNTVCLMTEEEWQQTREADSSSAEDQTAP